MSEPTPDEDLHALFARQRTAVHEHAPGFHAMRKRALSAETEAPSIATLLWRWAVPAVASLVLAAAVFLTVRRNFTPAEGSREAVVREIVQIDVALQKNLSTQDSLTAWQSPTDFLLNLNPSTHP